MNGPSPLVSVIIPTFNSGERLSEAVESIFAQDYQNIELIVVDDGSTDDVASQLHGYRDRFKLVQQENGGVALARNVGLRRAQGQYIHFLDADDVLSADAVSAKLTRLQSNPHAGICINPYECVGENGVVDASDHVTTPLGGADCPTRDLLYTTVRRFPMSLCGMLAPRLTWRSMASSEDGPFDEQLRQGSDLRVFFRMALRRIRVVGVDRPLTTVRLNRNSLTANRDMQLHFAGHVYLKNLIDLLSQPDAWPYVGTMLRWYWSEALATSMDKNDSVSAALHGRLSATVDALETIGERDGYSASPLVAVIKDHCFRRNDIAELFNNNSATEGKAKRSGHLHPGQRDRTLWLSAEHPDEFRDTNQAAEAIFLSWFQRRRWFTSAFSRTGF